MARRGRPAGIVQLMPEERAELEGRVRASTASQRDVLRARIILRASEGGSAAAVAKAVGACANTADRWRRRFLHKRLKGLNDRPRPGRKPKFTLAQRMEIIGLACDPVPKGEPVAEKGESSDSKGEPGEIKTDLPPRRHRRVRRREKQGEPEVGGEPSGSKQEPIEKKKVESIQLRTIKEIRAKAIEMRVSDAISWSSVQRILSECEVKPFRVRGWLHSPDPQFREKVTEICDLYLNSPEGSVVISVDEKPGMQALQRRFPDHWDGKRVEIRREFEYKRHGTQTLIAGFAVHTGKLTYRCGDTRTGADLVAFMDQLAEENPTGIIHIIWDQLNIHFDGKDARWTQFNQRHGGRFVFHYTPKHASWVNQVELFFSILERCCLRYGSFRSKAELHAAVVEFIERWNRELAHPFRWTFKGYPMQSGVEVHRVAS